MRRAWASIILYGYLILTLVSTSFAASLIPSEGLQAEGEKEWQKAISIYFGVLSNDPNRVDLWLRIGSIEHHLNSFPLAIDAYQRAALLQPNNAKTHKILSEIYAESNQPREALAEINKAVALRPKNAQFLLARTQIANWNNDLPIAMDSYQRLVTLRPDDAALHAQLSQIYAETQNPEQALNAINQALTLEPNNIQFLESKATFATWLENYELALNTYQQILKLDPGNQNTSGRITFVEHLIKSTIQPMIQPTPPTQVSTYAKKKIVLTPLNQLLLIANNAASTHHYGLAALIMKKAIALKPTSAILYKKLSEIYAMEKKPHEALLAINQALRLEPTNIPYLRAKAQLAAWLQDKQLVEKIYIKILQLKPNDEDALLNYAHSLSWQGKVDAAITAYEHLLDSYPKNAEGWIQYAEVLSWTQNYIGALNALEKYRGLKGKTMPYNIAKARFLALANHYQSSLAINEPLLQAKPTDSYVLSTEVIALTKAFQIDQAINYLKKLHSTDGEDTQIEGLKKITLTPLRSNINVEGDQAWASDTTRISDIPLSMQYFLDPTTSVLVKGLYEYAYAAPGSGLETVNGQSTIADESMAVGFTKQINGINLKAVAGGLNIQNENSHAIYDASLNTNLNEKTQVTIKSLHDLFRPYLIPQSPESISLQVMETRTTAAIKFQPSLQKYLDLETSYSTLSDNNDYWHINAWPKARVYGSEHWLATIGVDGDFWHFKRNATDGYYSPTLFQGYEGTLELYYGYSENIGCSFSAGFGAQKDETFPHYYYEEDLAMRLFLGIFTDWEIQVKGGYTLRDNPTGNYNFESVGLVITKRF